MSSKDNHLSEEYSYLKTECYKGDMMRYHCKFCYFKSNKGATFNTFLYHIVTEHTTEESLFKMKINPRECQHACSNCNLKFVNENVLKYHELMMHKKLNVAQKRARSKAPIQNDLKCQLCYAKFKTPTRSSPSSQ